MMGTSTFIFFIVILLISCTSPILGADDSPQENLQFGIEELELDGMINGFDNELKQEEIIRKLEEEDDADDARDMNHLDSLTSLLEGIAPMDLLEGKLQSNKTCRTCHRLFDELSKLIGDTDKQASIIKALLEKCEAQTIFDDCKEIVFSYGPLCLNSLHKVLALDLCYMVGICPVQKNQTSSDVELIKDGRIEPPNFPIQARKLRI